MTAKIKELTWDYFLFMNIVGFLLMGLDKMKAIQNGSRIPEKWFFVISSAGGPFGVFFGMLVFHHKTRKASFGFFVTVTFLTYTLVLIVLTLSVSPGM